MEGQYLKNLEIALKNKNVNSTYLTKTKYDELISEVKELKLKSRGHKLLKK